MNLPPLKRILPVLALLAIAGLLIVLPHLDAWFFAESRYAQCSRLLASDPGQALNFAQAWRAGRPQSPLARHCEALALYATKDYGHAAEAFAALASQTASDNPALAARIFLQSARAHKGAGHIALARQTAASALLVQPGNAEAKALLAELGTDNAEKPPVTGLATLSQKK